MPFQLEKASENFAGILQIFANKKYNSIHFLELILLLHINIIVLQLSISSIEWKRSRCRLFESLQKEFLPAKLLTPVLRA